MATTGANLTIGTWIYIHLGGATGPRCVGVTSCSGTITRETEKAVEVTLQDARGAATTARVWFPRRALVARRGMTQRPGEAAVEIARWFRLDGYAERMIERYQSSNVLCA